MGKIVFLVGLPGSGKSRIAAELEKREKAVILSTDAIRIELFGDETARKKTSELYSAIYERAKKLLEEGKTVVLDATNIERERRMKALKKFSGHRKECVYLDVPYEVCLARNASRRRKVPEEAIAKMRVHLQVPIKDEGFDEVRIAHEPLPYGIEKEAFEALLKSEPSRDALFSALKGIPVFAEMDGFNQDNPHHSRPLCGHTHEVMRYINEQYAEEDKFLMQTTGLFHDAGKPFCKTYKKGRDYASYFGHENVSAQLCVHFLKELGFEDEFVFAASHLALMHMQIAYGGDEGASEIYHLLGGDALWKLYFFKEADTAGK